MLSEDVIILTVCSWIMWCLFRSFKRDQSSIHPVTWLQKEVTESNMRNYVTRKHKIFAFGSHGLLPYLWWTKQPAVKLWFILLRHYSWASVCFHILKHILSKMMWQPLNILCPQWDHLYKRRAQKNWYFYSSSHWTGLFLCDSLFLAAPEPQTWQGLVKAPREGKGFGNKRLSVPTPGLFLVNLCSIINKTDGLRLLCKSRKDETWLSESVPDNQELASFWIYRMDNDP